MTPGDSSKPTAKNNRMPRIFFEREPSVRKQNIERESRITFLARTNFLFALLLLCNAVFTVYAITKPHQPSRVIVQYFTDAGKFKEIQTVPLAALPPPRITDKPQIPLMADPFGKMAAGPQQAPQPTAAASDAVAPTGTALAAEPPQTAASSPAAATTDAAATAPVQASAPAAATAATTTANGAAAAR